MASEDCSRRKVWYAPHKFEAYGEEEIKAVEACLRDGWIAGNGPRTEEFEEKVSEFFGKKYGCFVNSGSSANMVALCIANVGPGVEVITPALTFSTVIAPVVQLGGTPVFCDGVLDSYVPSVDQVMACVTEKTKVIFVPNLVGAKMDWKECKKRCADIGRTDIILIEDSCDTMTHTPESDIAVISFYASHVITAGGGGGMCMMNTLALKNRALMYRDWGRKGNNVEDMSERFGHDVDGIDYDFKFLYEVAGFNFKSSEMNAAFGLEQMKKLPHFLVKRRANIDRYFERLAGSRYGLPNDKGLDGVGKFNWMAFPLQHTNRKKLLQFLEQHNVQTRVCFAGNVTRHPAFVQFKKDYTNADIVMRDGFLLGCHHGMTVEDVDYVCDLLLQFDELDKAGNA
jgi:CDP-6-deoxy-D-xylo-4-hexulose-3-dehydrase